MTLIENIELVTFIGEILAGIILILGIGFGIYLRWGKKQ